MENVSMVANGKGWREGVTTEWQCDGVFWDDATVLYPDNGGNHTCLKIHITVNQNQKLIFLYN